MPARRRGACNDDSVFAATRSGALLSSQRVLKAEVLRAIRAVSSGEIIFGAAIVLRMIRFFSQYQPVVASTFPELTEREREILGLMAQHLTNPEIVTNQTLIYPIARAPSARESQFCATGGVVYN